MTFSKNVLLAAAAILSCSTFVTANPFEELGDFFEGPFRGEVVRVIDADTIVVDVAIWPGTTQRAHIRLRNVDAPETRTTCVAEKVLGFEAAEWVSDRYPSGLVVRLDDIEPDDFGRFVADLRRWRSDRWLYLSEELIERGYALPSQDPEDRIVWCRDGVLDQELFLEFQ